MTALAPPSAALSATRRYHWHRQSSAQREVERLQLKKRSMLSTAAVAIAQLQRGSVLTDRPRLLDPRPPLVVLAAGGAGTGRGCGASNKPVSTAPAPASPTDGADPAAAGAAWPPTPMYIHGNACSAPLSSPPPAFLGGVGRAGRVTENGRTTCRYLSQGIHERVDIQNSTRTSAAIGHNRHIQERAIS